MRRIFFTATAAALAALPTMAGVPVLGAGAEASPVTTQPLAANEVLVELTANGEATARADRATTTVQFVCRGVTDDDARRAHDEQVERLRAAARAAGATDADIDVQPPVSMGMMPDFMDASMEADMGPDPAAEEAAQTIAPPPSYVVSGSITIRLRDPSRVAALEQALREVDDTLSPNTVYTASDDSPARREARADAIAAARADAEAYAAALGMRVARVVRVTERIGMDLMSMLISNPLLAAQMEQGALTQGPDIPVRVVVGVDFALAPR